MGRILWIREKPGGSFRVAAAHFVFVALLAATLVAAVTVREAGSCYAEGLQVTMPAVAPCCAGDPECAEMDAWYNGSNTALHEDGAYWLANGRYARQVRGRCILRDGRLVMEDGEGQESWSMPGGTDAGVNRDICIVLKALRKYVSSHGGFIDITGARGIGCDTVWISLKEKDGQGLPSLCAFVFNAARREGITETGEEGTEGPGIERPGLVYEMGMNYRTEQLAALTALPGWRDGFLAGGRVLEPALVDLNKEILSGIYGNDTGLQIVDFALKKYGNLYQKEPGGPCLRLVDLPNETRNFGGITVVFNDDETARTTLHISGK